MKIPLVIFCPYSIYWRFGHHFFWGFRFSFALIFLFFVMFIFCISFSLFNLMQEWTFFKVIRFKTSTLTWSKRHLKFVFRSIHGKCYLYIMFNSLPNFHFDTHLYSIGLSLVLLFVFVCFLVVVSLFIFVHVEIRIICFLWDSISYNTFFILLVMLD